MEKNESPQLKNEQHGVYRLPYEQGDPNVFFQLHDKWEYVYTDANAAGSISDLETWLEQYRPSRLERR